ncbi:hypothetical protein ED21_31514 [Erythrobacter sp. SD-21]|nr:hypothetical protein ED21_31514 [Erythrobacter sp. SD-21]
MESRSFKPDSSTFQCDADLLACDNPFPILGRNLGIAHHFCRTSNGSYFPLKRICFNQTGSSKIGKKTISSIEVSEFHKLDGFGRRDRLMD